MHYARADWPRVLTMTARMGFTVRAAVTAVASMVLAHNLIFIAGYGSRFGAAMARTGHDHGWTLAAATAIGLAGMMLGIAVSRLLHLRRAARRAGAVKLPTEPGLRGFAIRWLAWWIALTAMTAVLFVLEENFELSGVGASLPGTGVLTSATYPNAIAIIVLVALGISLVAALLGWRTRVLTARIEAAGSPLRTSAAPALHPRGPVDLRQGSLLGRRLAGRAPPLIPAS
jgi:hypothetical protein